MPTFQKLISLMSLRLVYLDKVITFSLVSFVCCSFFSISLTQISCGVGGLAWITRCCLARSWREQHFPLKIPFLFFILACLIAVIGAVEFSESYKSLKRLLEILIFFWAVNCVDNQELRDRLTLLLIASATISTLFSFYTTWETGLNHSARAEGTMSVYMTYAGLLMLAFLIAFGKVVFVPKENKWLYLAIVMMAVCLLLTFTRQAWLGVLAGMIFLVWFRKKALLWFFPIILGIVFVNSPATIKHRISSLVNLNDANLQSRIALWRGGWLVFRDHPLTGCGFKCIDSVHQNYPDPTGIIKRLRGLHNNFVQLAVDTGLLGLVSWISIWCFYFMALYQRLISKSGDQVYKNGAMGSAAAVIGFLVAGFFETNFYDSEVSMLLYFIMAFPFTVASKKRYRNSVLYSDL